MSTTSRPLPWPGLFGPVGWVGRSALAATSYVGGVMLLACAAAATLVRPAEDEAGAPAGFGRNLLRQLSWMLAFGMPLVGLVHIALGSFLALQAYYGSTFIDGTGAVVGVGLLRNLGGLMTGMTLSGILAARMIPELRRIAEDSDRGGRPMVPPTSLTAMSGVAAPRLAAAAVAGLLLAQWGIAVGTLVGWRASSAMMGLPSETFFVMMVRMLWFRDVVGLIIKGLLFGFMPGAICCYEGLGGLGREDGLAREAGSSGCETGALTLATPVFRATCLGIIAILIVNLSWFMLVYHAVPFYGPTLLKPPAL